MKAPAPVQMAVTERGQRIGYTEQEVAHAMRLLVLNGGRPKQAAEQLVAQGVNVTSDQIRKWRDRSFKRLYWQVRRELARDVGEEIAGRAFERAIEADEAERRYIEEAVERVDEVPPTHLAKNALALAQAKAANIEKAQLLRDRPTEIKETRSVGDLIATLERLKVVKPGGSGSLDVER